MFSIGTDYLIKEEAYHKNNIYFWEIMSIEATTRSKHSLFWWIIKYSILSAFSSSEAITNQGMYHLNADKSAACMVFTNNVKKNMDPSQYGNCSTRSSTTSLLQLSSTVSSYQYSRLNILCTWRSITRYPYSLVNQRYRPTLLNSHIWRFWWPSLVRSWINWRMDVRQ